MSAPHFSYPATRTDHDRHGRYPQALTLADFQHNLAAVQEVGRHRSFTRRRSPNRFPVGGNLAGLGPQGLAVCQTLPTPSPVASPGLLSLAQ